MPECCLYEPEPCTQGEVLPTQGHPCTTSHSHQQVQTPTLTMGLMSKHAGHTGQARRRTPAATNLEEHSELNMYGSLRVKHGETSRCCSSSLKGIDRNQQDISLYMSSDNVEQRAKLIGKGHIHGQIGRSY